ncbi:Crp/Fnr family transcriptional regulator [uncultured Shimia sp.]|uniref:Crp/Fnr family transcriptional regulator n=1 Tax=uncultured Shimia sp. TaxID=573152 RepID=UPI00261A94CC|nr:Crp/Fnr family transcriptional regulator [uncultured Shimia sp.]
MEWVGEDTALAALPVPDKVRLSQLTPMKLPKGARLFQPGDPVQGYAIVLAGRVDVTLATASGREILIYSVVPGQSCIQSTLGLMGGDTDYSAQAETTEDTRLVLLPRALFSDLMATSDAFRAVVFNAFAGRMQLMMEMLEKLAFQTVEARLAERLLKLETQPAAPIHITQAELAAQLGTAREVVSRRLETWAKRGIVETGRGTVMILDRERLRAAALAERGAV